MADDKGKEPAIKTAKAEASTAVYVEKPPRLGETIQVKPAPDVALVNAETGADFVPGQAVSQTVTALTLRRLRDGDLIRV